MKIGFIGTGVMGCSIVGHLLAAGHELTVYNRTKSKAAGLLEAGAHWADTPKEIAENSEIVMTMVGYPADVEEVYFHEQLGLLPHAKTGTIFIDLTTSTPTLAKKIYTKAKELGAHALDAPVSGGDIGAKNASLTIMVGGDEQIFTRCQPLLSLIGKNIVLQGGPGCGQHTKMCNQIAIASGMLGVCEALNYAEKSGLNPERVLESIAYGAAGSWSLSNYGPRILQGDFDPGFFIKHFIKDMNIAIDEADKMDIAVPGLKLAEKLYHELADAGNENAGTQALYKWYKKNF